MFPKARRSMRRRTMSRMMNSAHVSELEIMNSYDYETLLHTHQFFPILVSFVNRRLRPASYYGTIERRLRRYATAAPPLEEDEVQLFALAACRRSSKLRRLRNTKIDAKLSKTGWRPLLKTSLGLLPAAEGDSSSPYKLAQWPSYEAFLD